MVLMAILAIGFTPQVIYVLLFFLKPKQYPKAKQLHKAAIVIPAHDEAATIATTVKSMLRQNYPQDRYSVYVIADNCTDHTAQLAQEAGATVIEHNDPTQKSRGFAVDFGTKAILERDPEVEFFVMFDADNLAHPDYLARMNDAIDSGVELARGYSNSKNIDTNISSAVSGIYYLRDARFCCHVRSAVGLDQNLTGAGMTVHANIIRDSGFDAHSICEDAEFNCNRMLENKRTYYVSEAQYYEEQPTSMQDVFARNIRFGHGLNKLFYHQGFRMVGKFFQTGRISYIDMFLQLMFIPIAMICCVWIPIYYGFYFIDAGINFATNPNQLYDMLKAAGLAIGFAFYVPFVLQALFVVLLERKKIKGNVGKLIPICLIFPFYMIVYMIAIAVGTLSPKPKWKKINHHVNVDLENFFEETSAPSIAPLAANSVYSEELPQPAAELDLPKDPVPDSVSESVRSGETSGKEQSEKKTE